MNGTPLKARGREGWFSNSAMVRRSCEVRMLTHRLNAPQWNARGREGWFTPALLVTSRTVFVRLQTMARKWSNRNLPGALHFVSGNFQGRVPVFKRDTACQA